MNLNVIQVFKEAFLQNNEGECDIPQKLFILQFTSASISFIKVQNYLLLY